jgi:MFS family permease
VGSAPDRTTNKTVRKKMALIYLFLFFSVALASVALLVFPEDRLDQYNQRMPWISTLVMIAGFIVFIAFVMTVGQLARGEISPLPWEAFSVTYRRHGMVDGLTSFFLMVSFLLWALLIPGHLKASSRKLATGKRPSYPYFINILVGLLLVTPGNPIYRLLVELRAS